MRTFVLVIAASSLAVGARAQGSDAARAAQENQLYMAQEALRQRSLELERQAFAAQQKAQTEQALANLQAGREARPPVIVVLPPDYASGYAATADEIRRRQDEASAIKEPRRKPQKPTKP